MTCFAYGTLQPSLPLETVKRLPRYRGLEPLRAGDFMVVHRHPSLIPLARQLKKQKQVVIVVDMQAHSQHRWPTQLGIQVPSTHSSLIVKGLVEASAAVYTSSLHLAIFAISGGIPFAVLDTDGYQSKKVRRYLQYAGIVEAMSPLQGLPETVNAVSKRVSAISESERQQTVDHMSTLTSRLHEVFDQNGYH